MNERQIKIALAQLNPVLGDITGNMEKLQSAMATAKDADLLVTSELYLCGYPPEDLVRKPSFITTCHRAIDQLLQWTKNGGPAVALGTPYAQDGKIYNAFILVENGQVLGKSFKHELPNYGVFDEKRVFDQGGIGKPVIFQGLRLGLMVCEDIWRKPVAAQLAALGAELLIVPNGSPYDVEKMAERINVVRARALETGLPILYVNQVGGQDELLFDGGSFVMNGDRRIAVQCAQFKDQIQITRWGRGKTDQRLFCHPIAPASLAGPIESDYQAMTLALRDYITKNRFPGIVLGLSGGIDSALSAAVAVDALGPDRVRAVMMPSEFTSNESLEDAQACAQLLGISYDVVPIDNARRALSEGLAPLFGSLPEDATEENIQARLRGVILMAISNKTGFMVLTTGNKSEMAVGYATLYGDMCGGYSVLKDVYKTNVFKLSRWRNEQGHVMPDRVLTKAPTAELKPNQTDQDTLPPYDVLDGILSGLIEEEKGIDELAALGYDRGMVEKVWGMLDRAEYKRRQAPPGVKLTRRAFGRERRYPMTNRFWNVMTND